MSESETPTVEGIIVQSPQPLPNKMASYNYLYYVCLGIIVIGLFEGFAILGIIALLMVYTVGYYMVRFKRAALRDKQFAFKKDATLDELFLAVQPVLISKYNMLVNKDNDRVSVEYNSHIFDITLNDNATFGIWWRMSVGKAMISFNNYKSYKRILAGMGIIAYEIQKAFDLVS